MVIGLSALPDRLRLDTISGADPLSRSITVDFPTVLLRDLLQLSSSVGFDDDAVSAPLKSLMEDLQAAVPSYRGLNLTIVDNSHPVSLTAFLNLRDGDSITTSLSVRFAALGPGWDRRSRVVFYAARSGAFVDLAADFEYALGTPASNASPLAGSAVGTDGRDGRDPTDGDSHVDDQPDRDGQHGPDRSDQDRLIVLDCDIPPTTTRSGLLGLDERSMIDRAIGVMLDQGHHPADAHATLRRHAAAAGVEPHIYAARVLRR